MLAGAALALSACGAAGPNVRESSASPNRIVSLSPALTEILFAVGAGDRVVGVTDFCDWPPEAASRSRVGGFANPSIESVLALRPDLVLASPGPGNRDAVLAMERAGLRVTIAESETLGETYSAIEEVGRSVGAPERAAELIEEIRGRIEAVSRRLAGSDPVPTLFCLQVDPIMAAGAGTLPSEILEAAGGRNVVAEARYPRLGIESVMALEPRAILQSRMDVPEEGEEDMALRFWSRWAELPAVRDGRVFLLPGSAALRPGPRVADAVEQIAALLHPTGEDAP